VQGAGARADATEDGNLDLLSRSLVGGGGRLPELARASMVAASAAIVAFS
jgi:hypothetical protein